MRFNMWHGTSTDSVNSNAISRITIRVRHIVIVAANSECSYYFVSFVGPFDGAGALPVPPFLAVVADI